MTPESDAAARAYLLGELPDDRVAALEQALLAEPALLDHVQQAEHDLVDDYVDDRLSLTERTRFETYYLASPIHRDRVTLSRALAAAARQAAPAADAHRRSTAPRSALHAAFLRKPPQVLIWASAATLLVVAASWFALRPAPSAPVASPTVAEAPPASTAPLAPIAEPTTSSAAPVRVALLLASVSTRGTSTTPRLAVPQDAAFIDLRLDGPRAERAAATVEIRSVDDRLAWQGAAEPAPDRPAAGVPPHAWVASVPADRLRADDYILTLADARAQVIARYFFRISRQR